MKTFNGNQEELIAIVESALVKDSVINVTLNSFNHFVEQGLKQISHDVFELSYVLDAKDTIERDTTTEKYTLDITIDDVRVGNPSQYDHTSQQNSPMFSNEALLRDLTYCSGVYVDVTMIARAFHKNGTVSTEKLNINITLICKLPTMVKSRMCNTYNRSSEALIQLQEDPSDLGGYFVINGNQYIIINTESMKYNESREFANEGHNNGLCRADIISKPGDAFENSYNCILKLLNNNSIIVDMHLVVGFKEIDIPFFMFFRALGVYSAKEIMSYITYSFDDSDPITKQMKNILERALTNNYNEMNLILKNEFPAKKGESSGSVNVITNPDDVLQVLTRCMKPYDSYKQKLRVAGEEDALHIERFLLNKLEQTINLRLFPHIGLSQASNKKKAAFLGHMIRRMLLVRLGVLKSTDRDSYKNKRINDSGRSYSRIFKTHFNFTVVQKLKSQFMKDFKNNSFADINLQALFKSAIKAEEFEKQLMNAIVSGDKTVTTKTLAYKSRLSSQQLHHKNKLNVLTTLRSFDTPNKNNSAKSSERSITLRQVHPTGTGYICGITSADTGAKVGMSKQLSVFADTTAASSSEVLKHIVNEDPELTKIDVVLSDMTVMNKYNFHKIYNEDPLVTTFAYKHIPPMVTNAIVAISIYGGYNQEDSLIVNRSSVDRGMFDAAHMTYDKIEVEQNEIVCRPDPNNTSDIKSYCNYEKLIGGIIPEGTFVQEGDCLVGKVAKLQKGDMKDPNIIYTDRSMVYRKKEPAYVWKVIHANNYDDRELIKIVFKTFRSTEIGCKFCLTPEHEVLTTEGWISIADTTPEHQIAAMSPDGKFVYETPMEVHQFRHQGKIYKCENKRISRETTLEHKMYADITIRKNGEKNGPDAFQRIEVKDLLGLDYRVKKCSDATR
ncbi:hypothetical protein Poli38472_014592 [Pythium oligandrum]|uniref:DNA-directed RNA polymerase n=1 Tax=Pythium oligandrum TaxID=41045 RepID=A0A8K1FL01_PYTOL|nr:hypothetical protein Poli38472_014592 [Pythium oligandrum]|eukprot:TMW66616.1 hypothetical protein Poli38472_014592 [Pythium oligandrum]